MPPELTRTPPRWSPSRWINASPGRLWLLLGAACLLLFLTGLGNHGFWGAEEPYVGGIIREMADSRDWVVPTLNGIPFLEKPPLYYVTGVLIAKAASSFAPWVLRLPSALFALATLAWIAWLGARRESPAAGWWAALCLATSDLFFRIGHKAVVDMSLVFAVSLGLGLVWLLLEEPEHRSRWIPWLWVSLGLAFLAKGPIGPVLILLPLGAHLALFRDTVLLRRLLRPQWGMACGVVMAGAWVALLCLRGGWAYLDEALVRNTVGRFFQLSALTPATGAVREHRENVLYYLRHSPFNLLPWLLPAAAALLQPSRGERPSRLFLLIIVVADGAFLSVSGMRRAVYFLPLAPLIFLGMGRWLEGRFRAAEGAAGKPDRTLGILLGITALLTFTAMAIAPWGMVKHYGLPWEPALAFTAVAAGAAALAARRLRKQDLRGLMDHALGTWVIALVLMNLVLPPLKDPTTRMADQAFRAARERIQSVGAEVWESGLSESELGLASLIIRKPLPSVKTLGEIKVLLAQDRPVVVLTNTGAILGDPGLTGLGWIVRPEVPLRGVQGLGLSLILNRKAAAGYPRPPSAP